MRVGLNLLHAMPSIGGGWNYIQNLIQALEMTDTSINFVAYTTQKSEQLLDGTKKIVSHRININPENRIERIFYEQFVLPIRARRDNIALMHWFAANAPIFSTFNNAVTIHDLLSFQPNSMVGSKTRKDYSKSMIRQTVRAGHYLLPVSNTTKIDLIQMLGANEEKMTVIPCPLSSNFQPASNMDVTKFSEKFSLPSSFWLYVAHFYPHKNHFNLLKAYKLVLETGYPIWPLVLRGDNQVYREVVIDLVKQLGLESFVRFLPSLKYHEMPVLYSAATALVFASLFEGGGIPVMEAMACGCPIIGSDIPTNREFGGDALCLFNPLDVEGMKKSLIGFQSSEEKRSTGRQLGLKLAQKNSMPLVGNLLSQTYLKICEGVDGAEWNRH